jgi:hypothetical protein
VSPDITHHTVDTILDQGELWVVATYVGSSAEVKLFGSAEEAGGYQSQQLLTYRNVDLLHYRKADAPCGSTGV